MEELQLRSVFIFSCPVKLILTNPVAIMTVPFLPDAF